VLVPARDSQRNLYGFMFGGVILRHGFEKSHVAAFLHTGVRPTLLQVCGCCFCDVMSSRV
jgi:hypothetical protein